MVWLVIERQQLGMTPDTSYRSRVAHISLKKEQKYKKLSPSFDTSNSNSLFEI